MSTEKLKQSRQRLLDLTLRNRLLNFRPGNPEYADDLKTQKHIVLKGQVDAVWNELVETQRTIEILSLTPQEQVIVARELRNRREASRPPITDLVPSRAISEEWNDIRTTLRRLEQHYRKGDLISLLPEEQFHKRLTKIRNEQNTLTNSTGDSAMFLAIGFLQWSEKEPHPKAGERMFAPLILVHVNVEHRKRADGGHRDYLLKMDTDQPQGNPCLAEKLRQGFGFDFPDLDEGETASEYLVRITRLLKSKNQWTVSTNIALGFFNFARYRLWLDLDPNEWPAGSSPVEHPIVNAILNGNPLPQPAGIPDETEVACHQESNDLPIILDSDSTQYAALLACERGVSAVIEGPPGSGKSQTIANLIAIAMNAGKKVLFVAQKLPALQVVQRRLEGVGLDAFCLPLFSDKARVAEMHSHLARSQRIRESLRRPRPYSNTAMTVALRLNAFASRLRETAEGFDEGAGIILQRATAHYLSLRDLWGDQWSDGLLDVALGESGVTPEWLDQREQTLHQWHGLFGEVGNIWSAWSPIRLGPMDVPSIEAVIKGQSNAAGALREHLQLLPREFHESTGETVDDLCSAIRKSQFEALTEVLPSLLKFLWKSLDNANAVARVEREVVEFNRQLATASKHLRLTTDNRKQAGGAIAQAMYSIGKVVNLRYSLPQARTSIAALNEAIRIADDFVAVAATQPDGICALSKADLSQAESNAVKWIHLDILSRQKSSPDLGVPPDSLPTLALYVLDDRDKERQAEAFAESLDRFRSCVNRVQRYLLDPFRWDGNLEAHEAAVRFLLDHGLGDVPQSDFAELNRLVRNVVSGDDCRSSTFFAFSSRIFPGQITAIQIEKLKRLAEVSSELLRPPTVDNSNQMLSRAVRQPNSLAILDALISAIESHRQCLESVRIHFGATPADTFNHTFLMGHVESSLTIKQLALQELPLSGVIELKQTIAKIREAIPNILASCAELNSWPYLVPETVREIRDLRNVLLHLVNRPPFASDVSWDVLCKDGSTAAIATAKTEANDLSQFRQKYSDQVAFNDLPDVKLLGDYRRELRKFMLSWSRWFSKRYYALRREIRSFLKPPFPSDARTVALLEELAAYEQRRIALDNSSTVSFLGHAFHGMDTDWTSVALITHWLGKIKTLSAAGDISPFVLSSVHNMEKLREILAATEVFLKVLEQQCRKLPSTDPYAGLTKDIENVPLRELVGSLREIETRLNSFIGRVQKDMTCRTEEKCATVLQAVSNLEAAYDSRSALDKFTVLLEPTRPADLNVAALVECRSWLNDIYKTGLAPELIMSIVDGAVSVADQPFAKAASTFHRNIVALIHRFPGFKQWIVDDLPLEIILDRLGRVVEEVDVLSTDFMPHAVESSATVDDIARALVDLRDVKCLKTSFDAWKTILGQNPESLEAQQVRSTLTWLVTLRELGAGGDLLRWLMESHASERIRWWQDLIARGELFGRHLHQLQNVFVSNLNGSVNEKLTDWCSEWKKVGTDTLTALEVAEAYSQSAEEDLQNLSEAASSLLRAIEIQSELAPWKTQLNLDPILVEPRQFRTHRTWTATVKTLPGVIGEWLVSADTPHRCELILALEGKLGLLKNSNKKCREVLESFGPVEKDGPFEIVMIEDTLCEIQNRCQLFVTKLPQLPMYAALLREEQSARTLGITNIIEYARKHRVSTELSVSTLRGAAAYQKAKQVWSTYEELKWFQAENHQRLRQKFQREDEGQLKTNREFIYFRLGQTMPAEGIRGRTASEHTQNSLLQHEMQKQRRHLPIRKLVQRASRAMQDLCPCWMMTPLSVAQFLAPGSINFDVVIMDEASQINPEDAWGAMARGKQVVIVGDQKQMPPSDFFMSALEEDELPGLDDDSIDGGKAESILDASFASLLSSSLLWHYRSRHETLIAPANSFSYDNRLILFPHPHREHPDLGVRYHFVKDATTTTGKVVNAIEADAVARRVRELILREYAKHSSERLSIGVVTMNLPQQDCVMDLLETMQRADRRFDIAMTGLAADDVAEPFFVRNLENIQGDERDIMIISCTYGPNIPGGTPTQRFGPLTREGGERRFNVLITRAKWRMEVFASIRSDQIVVDGKRQGVRDFHLFLKYAETGRLDRRGVVVERPSGSPFEVQVEAILRREGFEVERQVGVAGYFIDLAVKHSEHPGLFAIGIECDGATYHSSRAARDRDRLREKVLIERGWKLHRIWSTDWFVNPQQEKAKLIDAVRKACHQSSSI